jgi:HPt (histidine-containing phosphotransfer) domain-containing protein
VEIFDPERVAQLIRDLGPETLVEFLQMLPGELAGLQVDLARGIESADAELITRTRHTIKGMCNSIGATGLARTAGAVGKDDQDHLPEQMAEFARQVLATCAEAEALIVRIQADPERVMAMI